MGNGDSTFSEHEQCIIDIADDEKNYEELKEDEKLNDLMEVFLLLRKRCPDTWNTDYEKRASEFHKHCMTLRKSKITQWMDPNPKFDKPEKPATGVSKDDDTPNARNLMTNPKLWKMLDKKNAEEFYQILRHVTRFAPSERHFIRAWLEALFPCFCRWVLLSAELSADRDSSERIPVVDSSESSTDDESTKGSPVVKTLKHFFGAFGQPGIVICLPDKGVKMLQTLKYAASAVEAVGRGDVQRYYSKRLMELSYGIKNNWDNLTNIATYPLKISQLDCLPADWLQDANDHAHVFAEVVSEEITPLFEKLLKNTVGEKYGVHKGPPKTLSRTLAKATEYMAEYEAQKTAEKRDCRWVTFGEKFEEVFGRTPCKPSDFVWNIVDFARCSIEVPTANDAIKVKELVEKRFEVVSVKNGYNLNETVKGSGYRDMKLLVKAEFDDLELKGIPKMEKKTTILCEIQIVCKAWLQNKKTTSLSYKIFRAASLKDLFNDFTKYTGEGQNKIKRTAMDVIKNGYINLAKIVDFSGIDGQKVLYEAAREGWEKDSVSVLVNTLKINHHEKIGYFTPLQEAARYGSLNVLQAWQSVVDKNYFRFTENYCY